LVNISLCNENEKNESQKNFLKNSSEKKVLKSKTDTSIQANIQLALKTAIEMPLIANRNLEKDKEEEEKYELERANAMAEFIF
jgi:hypothetical protein